MEIVAMYDCDDHDVYRYGYSNSVLVATATVPYIATNMVKAISKETATTVTIAMAIDTPMSKKWATAFGWCCHCTSFLCSPSLGGARTDGTFREGP